MPDVRVRSTNIQHLTSSIYLIFPSIPVCASRETRSHLHLYPPSRSRAQTDPPHDANLRQVLNATPVSQLPLRGSKQRDSSPQSCLPTPWFLLQVDQREKRD